MALGQVVAPVADPDECCVLELSAQLRRISEIAGNISNSATTLAPLGNLGHPRDACFHAGRLKSFADMLDMMNKQLNDMLPVIK